MDLTTMILYTALCVSPFFVIGILILIFPEWRFRLLGTPYYKIHIMEKGIVLKTIYQKIKNQLIYQDYKQGVSWIIPDKRDLITVHKVGLMWFADKRSCCAIKIEDKDYQDIIASLKREKNLDSIIAKIPVIHYFYLQHAQKIDKIFGYETKDEKGNIQFISGKKGFAAKVKLNPEFMIDAISFFHVSSQMITDKIIKNPVSLWEMIERNLPLIIIGVIICLGLVIYSTK